MSQPAWACTSYPLICTRLCPHPQGDDQCPGAGAARVSPGCPVPGRGVFNGNLSSTSLKPVKLKTGTWGIKYLSSLEKIRFKTT
ncbi:hypothetical protein QYF61_015139 [Mycteria americana]|uniref:Uncharacterized protein n=1 Tax=Mycteria americana TaxID=33587 RepID=A0AAN7S3K8_MYCAM|nr:hypothetical protein QYF61_015139 [Mycteria americana]